MTIRDYCEMYQGNPALFLLDKVSVKNENEMLD